MGVVVDQLNRELKHSMRRLRAAPGAAIFAVVTLAIGIGVAAAAFSVIYSAIWRPLGVRDAGRLVVLTRTTMARPGPVAISWDDYAVLARDQQSFGSVAAWLHIRGVLSGLGTAESVTAITVTGSYFETLGVEAVSGRVFAPADDAESAEAVAVLSDAAWRTQFGKRDVVGQSVTFGGRTFRVVGIAPDGFHGVTDSGLEGPALWIPIHVLESLQKTADELLFVRAGGDRSVYATGRVRSDRTTSQAAADVAAIGVRLDTAQPLPSAAPSPTSTATGATYSADAARARAILRLRNWSTLAIDAESSGADESEVARVFAAIPTLLLLVACTNLANLVLSRGAGRRHDFAVRRALGASRWRLIREQLVEQTVIVVVGSAAGFVVAHLLVSRAVLAVQTYLGPFIPTSQIDWSLTGGVLMATMGAGLLSIVVCGLVPALHLTRDSLRTLLAQDGTSTPRWRGRGNLISLQVGVSVGLFLIAVLLVRIAVGGMPRGASLAQQDTAGYPVDRWTLALIKMSEQPRDPGAALDLFSRLRERAAEMPGVESAAVVSNLPFRANMARLYGWADVTTPDRPFDSNRPIGRSSSFVAASPEVFDVFGVALQAGRGFTAGDRAGAEPVAVINEGLARNVFKTADPLGQKLLIKTKRPDQAEPVVGAVTIVGVAPGLRKDQRGAYESLIYVPVAQHFWPDVVVVTRSAGAPVVQDQLKTTLRSVDPELAIAYVTTGEILVDGPAAFIGVLAATLLTMAMLALSLAMAGLYGVLSHIVARRMREMGIRMALGADRWKLALLVLKDGFRPIVEGFAIGIATAIVVRYLIKGTLLTLETPPVDPIAFVLSAVLLGIAGGLACYLPARRASRVDPNVALRQL